MKNHEFTIEDRITKNNGDVIVFITLSKYNMTFEDVKVGDIINSTYEILEKDKMKDMLFGYTRQSAGYRVKILNKK